LGQGENLNGHLELQVPAGPLQLRAVITQPATGAGDLVVRDQLMVPDFGAEGLRLTDLVTGRAGAGPAWVPVHDTVWLAPGGAYPEGSVLQLYYEIHGLSRGDRYHTRIDVRREGGGSPLGFVGRLFGGRGRTIGLETGGVAEGRRTSVLQGVNLSSLERGWHRLTLTVEDRLRDVRHKREMRFLITRR
jgi:hypothetical protein